MEKKDGLKKPLAHEKESPNTPETPGAFKDAKACGDLDEYIFRFNLDKTVSEK